MKHAYSARLFLPRGAVSRLRGFTIVSALFVLVVLAALGAAILALSSSQHIGSALDIEGARAYQAARAGAEWALYQRIEAPAQAAYCNNRGVAQINSFPLAGSLAGYRVTVSCLLQNESHPVAFGPLQTIGGLVTNAGLAVVTPVAPVNVTPGLQVRITGAGAYNGTHTVVAVNDSDGTFSFRVPAALPPFAGGSFELRSQALDRRAIVATACNEPVNGACPNPAPASLGYVQRIVQLEF